MKTYLFHVILFSFLENVDEKFKKEILARFATLGDDCGGITAGIMFFKAQENLDTRKKIDIVEIAIFKDDASFQNFKQHSKHVELVELLKVSTNWVVGDIYSELPHLI